MLIRFFIWINLTYHGARINKESLNEPGTGQANTDIEEVTADRVRDGHIAKTCRGGGVTVTRGVYMKRIDNLCLLMYLNLLKIRLLDPLWIQYG